MTTGIKLNNKTIVGTKSDDEELFQALQDDTTYELKLDNVSVPIYKVYKSGKRLIIEYNGGH